MALTNQQDIPKKTEVTDPWTFRRLFPFANTVTTLTKVFINPFDVLLGYLVFIVGIAELFGRHVSWFVWVLIVLILLADLLERRLPIQPVEKKDDKKK